MGMEGKGGGDLLFPSSTQNVETGTIILQKLDTPETLNNNFLGDLSGRAWG